VAVALSVSATEFLLAPVAVHRVLFRHHEKDRLVESGDRAARVELLLLGLAVASVVALIFSIVASRLAAGVACAITLAMLIML
jgi:hypothetical protein